MVWSTYIYINAVVNLDHFAEEVDPLKKVGKLPSVSDTL
jgi:hypothetical protein